MSTIHISAKVGEIAKVVIMPGDPLRAKHYANQFLENPKLINEVRGMLGYTGKLKGTNKEITVMGHGMGLDSIGIYSFELYSHFNVDTIIRFGSCGSYDENIEVGDLIVAEKSFTESNYGIAYGETKDTINANSSIVKIAHNIYKNKFKDLNVVFTTVNSSMWFYKTHNIIEPSEYLKRGISVVEMESYALYSIANSLGKNALTILTVSDNLITKKEMTSEQREKNFTNMFNYLNEILKEL